MLTKLLIIIVEVYRRAVSPYLGNRCRYFPSCSHYALEALKKEGLGRGLCMTLIRVLRCHPWGGHGYDPVP